MMRWLLLLRAVGLVGSAPSVAPFGRDERLDPLEIALGGLGAVLEQRAGVAVAAAGVRRAARVPRRSARAARRRSRSSRRAVGVEVAAERELQREACARRRRLSSSASSSCESRASPRGGDAVGLAGAAGRLGAAGAARAAARSPVERAGGRDRRRRAAARARRLSMRAVALEAAQRRVERAVGDAPERAERLAEALLQLVAVERLLLEQSEDGELEHVGLLVSMASVRDVRYIAPIYRGEYTRR